MGGYARATTDERGMQVVFNDGLSFRTEPINQRKKDIFSVSLEYWENGRLGDLLTDNKTVDGRRVNMSPFNRIAEHIVNAGYSAAAYVEYARNGITRGVRIAGKEFRADSLYVYEHAR